MRSFFSVFLILTMIVSLTACGGTVNASGGKAAPSAGEDQSAASGGVANDPKAFLVYAEVNPEGSLMGMTAQTFKTVAEELSGGSITINVQAGGVYGSEGDVLEDMISGGGADIARISTMSLKGYDGISVTNLLSVPYIFSSREHFWATTDSYIGSEIKEECFNASLNIHGLFFVEEGFRHFFFKDEVTGIKDLQGLNIRVSSDTTSMGMVEGLGATPITVAFTEVYSALHSGAADAAEQPIVNYQSNAFHQAAPYMILDGHTLGSGMVIISDGAWNKLTAAQQDVLIQAGEAASDYNRKNSAIIEQECRDELEAAGVTFIDVEDKQPWREACAKIISEVTAGLEEYTSYIAGLE